MIHTVKIPTGVSRMGCTPGGNCCSECQGKRTGPPIGAAATHVHQLQGTAQSGTRNAALHSRMGAEPDISFTIYGDSGQLPDDPGLQDALNSWASDTAAGISNTSLNELIAAQRAATSSAAAAPSSGFSISPAWIYAGVGLVALLLLEGGSRSRH